MPLQILAQAKPKDPPTDALPTFASIYTKLKRVGALIKENISGRLVDDWNKAISEAEAKPELVDMAPAVSTLLAVKDDEELVRQCIQYTSLRLIACRNTHEWLQISRLPYSIIILPLNSRLSWTKKQRLVMRHLLCKLKLDSGLAKAIMLVGRI